MRVNKTIRIMMAVLVAITVLAVLFGTAYHVAGPRLSFSGRGQDYGENERYSFDELSYDEVTSIKIDADVFNLSIRQGEAFSVTYEGASRLKPKVSIDGSELYIRQSNDGFHISNLKQLFGDSGDRKCSLTVTVPSDHTLYGMDVSLDLGSIELEELSMSDLKLEANLGNVELEQVNADAMSIDADMGNVELYDMTFKNMEASVDMGNIEVHSLTDLSGYRIELNADLGGVSCNGSSKGSSYHSPGTDGSVTIEADMGNIKLDY